MKEQNRKLTIAERLRNGEKVICAKCKKFYCNRCNSMVNTDRVIDIE